MNDEGGAEEEEGWGWGWRSDMLESRSGTVGSSVEWVSWWMLLTGGEERNATGDEMTDLGIGVNVM